MNMGDHMKLVAAPRSWPLPRKGRKWVMKPSPGPHSKETSLPLLVVVRDILHLAENAKEARYIINKGNILVDGVVRKDPKFPVGFFDVITIPKIDARYRVLIDRRGRLRLVSEPSSENLTKLYRVRNKTIVKKGRIQLNLHDGANILVEDQNIKPGDSLLLELPEKKILGHIPLKQGVLALITGGQHAGELSRVREIKVIRSPMRNVVLLEGFETVIDYVFPVGTDEPLIKIPPLKEEVSE
jgi:small subunit ribosomal protein S4e